MQDVRTKGRYILNPGREGVDNVPQMRSLSHYSGLIQEVSDGVRMSCDSTTRSKQTVEGINFCFYVDNI